MRYVVSMQLEMRSDTISTQKNGCQYALTAPIRRHIQFFLRATVGQCLTSRQHTVGTGGVFIAACGQEKKTESNINLGSFSRSLRRRTTHNQRETATLLHSLPQSLLVNAYIWQRPLSPREGASYTWRGDSKSQTKRQVAIENAFVRTTASQLQQLRANEMNTLRGAINADAFREAQMLLSARRYLPLNFATWPEYQALLSAVNPAAQELLIDSGNTAAAGLDRAYGAHQESVKRWLARFQSLVHIAMDVWSSPQRKAYIAVHAQWVDEEYNLRKALLRLPNLRHSHAGAAMTPHVMNIIRKYSLAHRISYFTGDNDAKNDTCLRQLASELSEEYGLVFDAASSRTRCVGHIINLSLQAFLFATSKQTLQAAVEQAQDEASDVTVAEALHDQLQSVTTSQTTHGKRKKRNDAAGWRSVGPLGKLHNIAVFMRNSTVRSDAWDDIAGKALGIDNITRWNSWFKLLDAAISQEGALSIFLNQYHSDLEGDILTHDDWEILKMTHAFLQPFHQATLEQQMEWASIDQVLENMDILFMQFEDAKVRMNSMVDYQVYCSY